MSWIVKLIRPGRIALGEDLSAPLRLGLLALACVALLIPAARILGSLPIYGDDHSSHMAAVHHLLWLARQGQTDLFCPTFNLGFPMYLYYQPLPHLTAALVHVLSFRMLDEQAAFNLTVVLLWCSYPLTVYAGARRLGLGQGSALLGGVMAPTVSSSLPFGLTLHSVMGLGLYTQLYAMVLLPLCVGWLGHALRTREHATRAMLIASGLMVLMWLSHAFYGMAAATVAVVMTLCAPTSLRRSLPRLLIMGAVTVASLLFWLLPLALTRDYMGGWPWGGSDRWEGYGMVKVALDLALGRVLDQGRFPVLTCAMVVGILLGVWRLRSSAPLRVMLVCLGLFVFFLMGRRTFGHLVDIQPANLGLQLFRYIGPVHLFAVLLAGCGLFWLLQRLWTRLAAPAVVAVAALLLAVPLADLHGRAHGLFRDMGSYSIKPSDLQVAGRAVDRATGTSARLGRVYSHNKTGHGSHLVAALLAMYTDQPLGQNYGVSLHDSLGFFFLEYLDPLDSGSMALYNFRHVVARPDSTFARKQAEQHRRPVFQRGDLALFTIPGTHGYFQPVDLPLTLVGTPRGVRPAALMWVKSAWPARGQFGEIRRAPSRLPGPVLEVQGGSVFLRQGGQARKITGLPGPPGARTPPGRVLLEQVGANRFRARVRMTRPGALVLKVAHHPFWQVEVNGRPHPLAALTPSFLGVRLPQGEHEVAFRFRNPAYQKVLLSATALAWLTVCLAWIWRRRTRKRA